MGENLSSCLCPLPASLDLLPAVAPLAGSSPIRVAPVETIPDSPRWTSPCGGRMLLLDALSLGMSKARLDVALSSLGWWRCPAHGRRLELDELKPEQLLHISWKEIQTLLSPPGREEKVHAQAVTKFAFLCLLPTSSRGNLLHSEARR